MGLDGCGKFIKFTMFAANFLILLGGIAVLAVGIWTCADKSEFETMMGSDLYLSAAYILIASGCIVIIISFIGCLGAVRENKCLLLTYFIILFIIFVIMLVGGILGYVFKGEVQERLRNEMVKTIEQNYEKSDKIQKAWDKLHREFKCCGVAKMENKQMTLEHYNIWKGSSVEGFTDDNAVPKSCCPDGVECVSSPSTLAYKQDCYDSFYNAIVNHALVVGGVGIGIACILILGMVFSAILFKMIE